MNKSESSNISVRLKVTGSCQWNCRFCHGEGGSRIDEIGWTNKTRDAMSLLMEAACVSEVHFTGGEPTLNRKLHNLTAGLSEMGLTVKTTTNGQFGEQTLNTLFKNGLKSFNFSVHSLRPAELGATQRWMSIRGAARGIERQKRNIRHARRIGAGVKINTVISGPEDIERGLEVLHFARRTGVVLRFLNDLNTCEKALEAIRGICNQVPGVKPAGRKQMPGSSSTTELFQDSTRFIFGVKNIRRMRIPSLCADCREKCIEQFYGIRVEQRNGKFFVRLCLHRSDKKSLMPLDRFVQSGQLQDILRASGEYMKAAA